MRKVPQRDWKTNYDDKHLKQYTSSPWGALLFPLTTNIKHTHTQTQLFNGLWSGTTRVGWYQKKHSPTHTHPDHRTSFIIFLHLQGSILFVHFTCLAVLSPGPLWSSSWSWTLNFILHTFLHPIIIFLSQHMPIPTQPVLLQYQCYVIYT